MNDVDKRGLEAWSRVHAVFMVGAFAGAVLIERPWPVAVVATISFAVLMAHGRGVWTAHLHAAWPNVVTALRVLVIGAIGVALHGAPGLVLAALVVLVFALDAVDGSLARRTGTTSSFGEHFDMEADAFLVIALGLELWSRGQLGAWVLVPGLLRYLAVLGGTLVSPRTGDMPRSRFGSRACGILVITLIAAFILPNPWATAVAAVGSALVVWSFALSFYGSYLRRAPLPVLGGAPHGSNRPS
jgi:phosphatidylglycerophosphate synthase